MLVFIQDNNLYKYRLEIQYLEFNYSQCRYTIGFSNLSRIFVEEQIKNIWVMVIYCAYFTLDRDNKTNVLLVDDTTTDTNINMKSSQLTCWY